MYKLILTALLFTSVSQGSVLKKNIETSQGKAIFKVTYWEYIKKLECKPVKNPTMEDCTYKTKKEHTIYGINKKYHPEYFKFIKLYPERAESGAIYVLYADYYIKGKINKLPRDWRMLVLDYSIHSGLNQALIDMQRALRVSPDGVIGNNTIRSAMKKNSIAYRLLYLKYRKRFFEIGIPEIYKEHKVNFDRRLSFWKEELLKIELKKVQGGV